MLQSLKVFVLQDVWALLSPTLSLALLTPRAPCWHFLLPAVCASVPGREQCSRSPKKFIQKNSLCRGEVPFWWRHKSQRSQSWGLIILQETRLRMAAQILAKRMMSPWDHGCHIDNVWLQIASMQSSLCFFQCFEKLAQIQPM